MTMPRPRRRDVAAKWIVGWVIPVVLAVVVFVVWINWDMRSCAGPAKHGLTEWLGAQLSVDEMEYCAREIDEHHIGVAWDCYTFGGRFRRSTFDVEKYRHALVRKVAAGAKADGKQDLAERLGDIDPAIRVAPRSR